MYEGGLRVPAVARWPAKIKSNQRTDHSAVTMDLFPTIAEAAGLWVPSKLDGISFLPILLGLDTNSSAASARERELYFVRREGGPAYGGKTIEALIWRDWKLIQDDPFQPLELYNLKNDPHEMQNRATEEKDVFQSMSASLRKHIQRGGQIPWQSPSNLPSR